MVLESFSFLSNHNKVLIPSMINFLSSGDNIKEDKQAEVVIRSFIEIESCRVSELSSLE